MLEITSGEIAELNDEDLRSLVGMLCESELRTHGLPTSFVTWGGNQNAADGGIDVRVRIDGGTAPGGFIPRKSVGFQIKKTDFTPGLIGPEMRPKDQLRPSISSLIDDHGGYIIVSSGSDTSDSALIDRMSAMRAAVADNPGQADLHLDFYDRNRLATWTRSHPGLILWVRQRIGRSMPGWQPYNSWAVSPDGIKDVYLLDDKTRLHSGSSDEKGVDVTQGINRIRDVLRLPRGVVRLAGLSGVGKTRLVQALFDARIGVSSLDPALVVYTDMKDNPSPQPTGMISDLIALQIRAIVVVDNCAPDLHRRIAEFCQSADSKLSTITVEYDVRDDEPEGTKVFRLEPSSIELVAKLVTRRFPKMMLLNVNKIADFSGGNARVAMALANTLENDESIAELQDEELFERLFQQRRAHDDDLLRAAQACALLYSFQGEAISGDDAELPKIAALAGVNGQKVYAKVAQLEQRDLVQRRSVWRAILPHAIANRLAKRALREIPSVLIEEHFNTERLMKSFSRRLGYLHDSDEACLIAKKWLKKDGYLANVCQLNEFGLAMFENIAPISPETTLATIEEGLSGPDSSGQIGDQRRDKISAILRSIAYDASFFDRCVALMISLAMAEQSDRSHSVRQTLEALFHIILSGTHATIEQRAAIVNSLVQSNQAGKRSLGIQLLNALLKAENFSATHSFDFGARVRDYGFWPSTREEQANWLVIALQLARNSASKDYEVAQAIRSRISQSLGRYWFLGSEVQDELEAFAEEIAAHDYWQEGWIAVRRMLSRPLEKANVDDVKRLRDFEKCLRPKNLVERTRAVVLSENSGGLDYAEMDEDEDDEGETDSLMAAYEKANAAAEELGRATSCDPTAFAILLPEMVTGTASRLFLFGRGLAIGSLDHRSNWTQLTLAVAKTEKDKQNVSTLVGFLNGLATIDRHLCEDALEESVAHETLGRWSPALQRSVNLSEAGVERLKRAASLGIAHPGAFHFLAWTKEVAAEDLRVIILSFVNQEHGYKVAIDILSARFHPDKEQKKDHPPQLVDLGRKLLSEPIFNTGDNMHDYHLHTVANVCLQGDYGSAAARSLCERVKQGLKDYTFRVYNHERTLQSVFQLQPRVALDVFYGDAPQVDGSDLDLDFDLFDNPSDRRINPLDGVSDEEIIRWCDEKPAKRYEALSQAVSYQSVPKEGRTEWTTVAMEILKRAPNPLTVLEAFVRRFSPMAWSGSRATIIESRLGLLDYVAELKNAALDEYVARIRPELVRDIARMRKSEDERDSANHERFE